MAIIVVENGQPAGEGTPVQTLNLMYFTTPPGIIKIVQFLLGVILMFLGPPIVLAIIVYLTFTLSTIWIWVYVFSFQKRWLVNPPWIVLEFYYTGGATLLYGLGTLLAFIFLSWPSAVFGALNTIAYSAATFFLFHDWRTFKQNPDVPKV